MIASTLKLKIFIDSEQKLIDRLRGVDTEEGVAFSITAATEDLPKKEEGKTYVLISGKKDTIKKAEKLGYRIVCLGDAEELEKIAEKTVEKITEVDEESGEDLPRILWPKEEGEETRALRFRNLLCLLKAEHDAAMFEAELQRITTTDALTGLHNRWYFEEFLKNNPDKVWTLLYIDLDGFKSVNDSLGHSRGDRVLVQVAEILQGIFPQAEHIRLSGDEFAVLLEEEVGEELLNARIQKLETRIQKLIPERPGLLSVSVGEVSQRGEQIDIDDFLREGDMKMYEVKRLHRAKKAQQPEYESADARRVLGVFQRTFIRLDERPRFRRAGRDRTDFTEQLEEIADYLRIGRIGVQYFDNQEKEHIGEGKSFDLYNNGQVDETRFLERRSVTGAFNITYYRAVIREGAEDWTDRERERVDLLLRIIFVFKDRERMMDIAERLYFYDTEMDVHNFKYFMNSLGRLGAERALGNYAAMRIDMKSFSSVNQQLGRQLGNLVMKRFVKGVDKYLSGDEMICRVGGDNYALLVEKDHEDDILDMLEETLIVYNDETGDSIRVGAAIGVYQIPDDGKQHLPGEIMDRISRACHRAKISKDISVAYFDSVMVEETQQEMKVEAIFTDALEKEEFRVYYQPKVNMHNYRLVGAEALCRWFRNGKMVPPGAFIPHLEQSMAICALDMYMLDHVCRDIRHWLDEGREVVRVSVNLSRRNLADVDILRHILEVIDRNNVPHEYIEIEFTETTEDAHFVSLRKIVAGLQENGVKTAVDDFGIGYSSLTLIRDLPWDVLKIDRSFLPNESDNERDKKTMMFNTVVNLAQGLGMECIVEGVETKEQLDLMQANRCDQAQGFFFDRPMPREEFELRLDKMSYGDKIGKTEEQS